MNLDNILGSSISLNKATFIYAAAKTFIRVKIAGTIVLWDDKEYDWFLMGTKKGKKWEIQGSLSIGLELQVLSTRLQIYTSLILF